MTRSLEQAFERISKLPDVDQDAIAALITDELDDEIRWQQSFDRSQDLLNRLAAEALREHREGKTKLFES